MKYLNKNATLIFHEKEYSYEEIKENLNEIKKKLLNCPDIQKTPVAITMERVPKLIFSIVALLELSIPFVPILLSTPQERKNYMFTKAGIENLLCLNKTGDVIIKKLELNDLSITDMNENIREQSMHGLAYILFTSGTTGKPKAVEVTSKGLDNFIEGIREKIGFSLKERIGCFTDFTFDIFFLESIFSLSQGLTVVLADENERRNPGKLLKLISQSNIETIQMTPSGMNMLITCDENYKVLKGIRKFLIGGECFPDVLLNQLQKNTKAEIYNMYGPTETTIWSIIANLTNSEIVHIGTPICNTKIKILDENLEEVLNGNKGEICILGEGLARGYCNDIEQTNSAFVKLDGGERCYRTGDVGCKCSGGYFVCNGRKDNQIKLHGHRIELEEIEQVVLEMDCVVATAACYDKMLHERIVLFYITNGNVDKQMIVDYLIKKMPQYMIPSYIVKLEKFIYNSSGKKDRFAILKSWMEQQKTSKIVLMKNDQFEKILNIIRKYVLDSEIIIKDSMTFSDIGIDSLSYIQLIADIEESFEMEFEDEMLIIDAYENLTSFASYVETRMKKH